MALTLTGAAASAAADAVVDLLDGGSGNSTGDIEFRTAGGSSVCICNLASPAFNAASNGVATAGTIAQGVVTLAGSNTITTAVFRDKSNAEVFRATVSLAGGGGDIILTGTTVNLNDTIDITSLTYTQPLS